MAAKISNEYIVPIMSADPSHFSAQKLLKGERREEKSGDDYR
jgi:hypothetical protein